MRWTTGLAVGAVVRAAGYDSGVSVVWVTTVGTTITGTGSTGTGITGSTAVGATIAWILIIGTTSAATAVAGVAVVSGRCVASCSDARQASDATGEQGPATADPPPHTSSDGRGDGRPVHVGCPLGDGLFRFAARTRAADRSTSRARGTCGRSGSRFLRRTLPSRRGTVGVVGASPRRRGALSPGRPSSRRPSAGRSARGRIRGRGARRRRA